MSGPRQFAVLQKDSTSPTAEQLKRAFRSFSNLTDADAVRLAVGAHGIVVPHRAGQEVPAGQVIKVTVPTTTAALRLKVLASIASFIGIVPPKPSRSSG